MTTAKTKTAKKTKAKTATKPAAKPPKASKPAHKPAAPQGSPKKNKYYEAIGRRKTARARVRLYTKGVGYTVNGKEYAVYFPQQNLQRIVDAPLKKMKGTEKFMVEALVSGGGTRAQAEALRHGIARALVVFNVDFRKRLKRAGYLTRDPRKKERKKYGLKKARKSPRWSKR